MIRQGDPEALEQLLRQNKKFIGMVANEMYRNSFTSHALSPTDLDDLIQEGNLGLLKAAQAYDPSHGTKFLTYAGQAVRNAMLDWLEEDGIRFEQKLTEKHKACRWGHYLDEPDTSNRWRIDIRDDPYTMTPEQIYLKKETCEALRNALDQCGLRGKAYLMYRFGFEDGKEHSKNEAAQRFHLKHSWAEKLEEDSLNAIRQYMREHGEYCKRSDATEKELTEAV